MGGWKFKVGLLILLLVIFSVGVISLTEKQIPASFFAAQEIYSPSDWVKEEQIKDLAKDLLQTINFLHEKSIVHRDLSPSNILVS